MADEIPAADTRALGPVRLMETQEELAYELRAAEGAVFTGGRFLVGIGAFTFASLAFAYFYLRTSNNLGLWRPHHATAPTNYGAAVFAIVLADAMLTIIGAVRLRRGMVLDWQVAWWTAVGGNLLAIALQILILTRLGFDSGSSGYASCYIGWAVLNILLMLTTFYWLEVLLARAMRISRAVAEDGGPSQSRLPAARMFRASLDSATYFVVFGALIELLFWLLFYVL